MLNALMLLGYALEKTVRHSREFSLWRREITVKSIENPALRKKCCSELLMVATAGDHEDARAIL